MCAVKLMARTVHGEDFDLVIPSPKRVVSIKLEIDLIEEIDRLWRSLGYTSRSEFIREAIIYYMQIVSLRDKEKQSMVSASSISLEESKTRNEESLRKDEPYLVIDTMTDIA